FASVLTVLTTLPPSLDSIRTSAPFIGCPLESLTIPCRTDVAAQALATQKINPTKPSRIDLMTIHRGYTQGPSQASYGYRLQIACSFLLACKRSRPNSRLNVQRSD